MKPLVIWRLPVGRNYLNVLMCFLSKAKLIPFFCLESLLLLSLLLLLIPASSYMVRPIRDLVKGTRALTAGEYSSKIKIRSSDELAQLSEDFNTLANTLDQNQTARRQWIADISHELRTPLAILRGELEAVQDGIRPLDPTVWIPGIKKLCI